MLAVILNRMWMDGTQFNWSKKKVAASGEFDSLSAAPRAAINSAESNSRHWRRARSR
jgi:hypothetical protein